MALRLNGDNSSAVWRRANAPDPSDRKTRHAPVAHAGETSQSPAPKSRSSRRSMLAPVGHRVGRVRSGRAGASIVTTHPSRLSDEWLYWDPEALDTFPGGGVRAPAGDGGDGDPPGSADRRPATEPRACHRLSCGPGGLCLAGMAGGVLALSLYLLVTGVAPGLL